MHSLPEVSYIAILCAAIGAFVLGGIWYGPLFSKTWMKLTGITEEKAKQGHPAKTFGFSFVAQIIIASAMAVLLAGKSGIVVGLVHGIMFGLCFVATSIATHDLFEQRPCKLWLINSGYHVVNFGLIGAIITTMS